MAVVLDERYSQTLQWICTIHAHQKRRLYGEPYISHLLRVGGMVLEYAQTQEEALAALLHDSAEDQGGRFMLEEIARRVGERTAFLVEQCSDSLEAAGVVKAPWRQRKEAHLARAANAEAAVKRILICDKIDNARDILQAYRREGESVFQHFHGGREIVWYFEAMGEVLRGEVPEELEKELEGMVRELKKTSTEIRC